MNILQAPGIQRFGRYLRRLMREFQRDQCPIRAASLAFTTLLALVPLFALLFSLFSALGTFTDFGSCKDPPLIQSLQFCDSFVMTLPVLLE